MNPLEDLQNLVLPIKESGDHSPLTKEQVVGAYKLFLEREPENDEVILDKLKCNGLISLIQEFISSREFLLKYPKFSLGSLDGQAKKIDLDIAHVLLHIKENIIRDAKKEPSLEAITTQLCTASQFFSPKYKYWCNQFNEKPKLHRKQWEFVYILEALEASGVLSPGKRGLGFGCGKEPLPAVMASRGCDILATDLDTSSANKQGWIRSNEHSENLDDLYWPGICSKEHFYRKVTYSNINMNEIPKSLTGYDFVWSSCAFEHLGSIEKGLQFVINSMECLRSGGVAVHTTEFNLSSNEDTFESELLVFFRKKDINDLVARLEKRGYIVKPLNLTIGERVEDGFVDLPPFRSVPHLKLAVYGYLTTSIGLIIQKI